MERANLLHDSIIKSLINRTFELKCPEMRLCITPEYTTEVFIGSGRIWITTTGQFRFSMLSKLDFSDLHRKWLPRLKSFGLSPQIYPVHDSDYLRLKALDLNEDKWFSNWIIPCFNIPKGQYIELYGHLDYLTSHRIVSKGTELSEFVILNPPNIPFEMATKTIVLHDEKEVSKGWSRNRQVIKSQDVEIQFNESSNNNTLLCTIKPLKEKPLLNNINIHVISALSFMLSTSLRPVYNFTSTSDFEIAHLTEQLTSDWKSGLPLPLNPSTIEEENNLWELFTAYFDYLMKQSNSIAQFHPISLEYSKVIQASKGSLEGFGLALSVSIEALLKICSKTINKTNIPKATDIEELLSHISKWNGNENLKKRTIGAIKSFNMIRSLDILMELKDNGLVTEKEISSWKKLRNMSAHGDEYNDFDKQKIQELCSIVSGLMHKIVLYEIDYKGLFTNYSKDNWPTEIFEKMIKSGEISVIKC
jgi:uncharacterized protein YutE (UPF0331/DUF86 family)